MTIPSILVGLFTLTGAVVWIVALAALLWYRPTPNGTLRGAIGQISWPHAVGFFIGPTALAGAIEFGGIGGAVVGGTVGASFVAFLVFLLWWWPI